MLIWFAKLFRGDRDFRGGDVDQAGFSLVYLLAHQPDFKKRVEPYHINIYHPYSNIKMEQALCRLRQITYREVLLSFSSLYR